MSWSLVVLENNILLGSATSGPYSPGIPGIGWKRVRVGESGFEDEIY